MEKTEINEWLDGVLPKQTSLTRNAVILIENLLRNYSIDYLHVQGRTKIKTACLEKIKRKKYSNPKDQLTDISAIRIICFFESQVIQISKLVKDNLCVDYKNSNDQHTKMGMDRVGYRSTHFVCTLGDQRSSLSEYEHISDLKFEIQIRTVLQHAWAELAHDRVYKFSGALPGSIERKLNLYAAMLEVIDGAFDEIAREVDEYKSKVENQSPKDIEEEEVNSISLAAFLEALSHVKEVNIIEKPIPKIIIEELNLFGIRKIGDLKSIISDALVDGVKSSGVNDSYSGFARTAMMYADIEKYISECWREEWRICDEETFELLETKYGGRVGELFRSKEIETLPAELLES